MKYSWLGQHDNVPEMDLEDFCRLMKDEFAILHEAVDGKPHWFRFMDSPYNPYVSKSLSVMTHHEGKKLSPLVIKQVLAKFDIKEEQFRSAYNSLFAATETASRGEMRDDAKPN